MQPRALRVLALAIVLVASALGQDGGASPADPTCRIAPKLGLPFGSAVAIAGVIVAGPSKGYEDGLNLRVQRIAGTVRQDDIQITLSEYFQHMHLPVLTPGDTVELEGFESGGFVGVPGDAYQRAGQLIQTTGFHFSHRFIFYQARIVPAIDWRPSDLIGQRVLLAGTAGNEGGAAMLAGPGWQLRVDAQQPWEPWQLGRDAEALGVVARGPDDRHWIMTAESRRLSRLADQIGHPVALRGTAWSRNGSWWFSYRGQQLHVEGMKDLPGWSADLHGCPMEISGVLEEAELPDIEQYSIKEQPDLKRACIVRRPTWRRIAALLTPELDPVPAR